MLIDVEAVMNAGAKFKPRIAEYNGSAVIEWQPGNGSCYVIMFTKVDEDMARILGCRPGAYLVSKVGESPLGKSWPFGGNDIAHESYVREKFDLKNDSDLMALTALINLAIPRCSSEYGLACLHRIPRNVA